MMAPTVTTLRPSRFKSVDALPQIVVLFPQFADLDRRHSMTFNHGLEEFANDLVVLLRQQFELPLNNQQRHFAVRDELWFFHRLSPLGFRGHVNCQEHRARGTFLPVKRLAAPCLSTSVNSKAAGRSLTINHDQVGARFCCATDNATDHLSTVGLSDVRIRAGHAPRGCSSGCARHGSGSNQTRVAPRRDPSARFGTARIPSRLASVERRGSGLQMGPRRTFSERTDGSIDRVRIDDRHHLRDRGSVEASRDLRQARPDLPAQITEHHHGRSVSGHARRPTRGPSNSAAEFTIPLFASGPFVNHRSAVEFLIPCCRLRPGYRSSMSGGTVSYRKPRPARRQATSPSIAGRGSFSARAQ